MKVEPTRKDTAFELAAWPLWIGKQVVKVSGKPFKSGERVNTVKGVISHPITGRTAFTFAEDDTFVECRGTLLVSGKPSWDNAPSWAIGLAFKCYGDPGELGEWCWMSSSGAQGFICYEQRPLAYLASADQRVQDLITAEQLQVQKQREAYRLAQSARDRAAYLKSQAR